MPAIQALDATPFHELRHLNAVRGGGSTAIVRLTFTRARTTGLPPGLDAIVATSDLQGRVVGAGSGEPALLGIEVAATLAALGEAGTLPPAARTGVLLAGDLYAIPGSTERGGYGDVAEVWAAFAARFAWVAGVAGNHDDVDRVARAENVHLLDTDVVDVGGLRVGGVGRIAGRPDKPGRRAEADQLERIALVAADGVDVLVLHEGPAGDHPADQRGHAGIRALVEAHAVPLTVCGHRHWEPPVLRHARGQILNVDARVVVLTR